MHLSDRSCAPILRFFSAASDGATAERKIQNCIYWSIFLPVWGSIASPIMHRLGRCLRRMLEDQMYFATH